MEIILDPTANAGPLNVVVSAASGSAAQFEVQTLELVAREGALYPLFQGIDPEVLGADDDGRFCISFPGIAAENYRQLGLIITRVDVDENKDPIGAYTIDVVSELDCK